MHAHVIAVERNLPPSRNFADQRRARPVLLVGPDVLRLPLVFNAHGVQIWIDARIDQPPRGFNHRARMKRRVGLLHKLVNTARFANSVVRGNGGPGIAKRQPGALERADDDVDDDSPRLEAVPAFAKILGGAADPVALHQPAAPVAESSPLSPASCTEAGETVASPANCRCSRYACSFRASTGRNPNRSFRALYQNGAPRLSKIAESAMPGSLAQLQSQFSGTMTDVFACRSKSKASNRNPASRISEIPAATECVWRAKRWVMRSIVSSKQA